MRELLTNMSLINFPVGDYVLTCGEIPALTMIDSVARLIPGALNNQDSALKDSFSYNY